MRIKSLKIENFRNIKDIQIFPNAEMNVIYGENAQGKTNIIEAIWLFTGAKSFRGAKDEELKRFSCEKARLKIEFEAEKIEKSAQIEINDKRIACLNEKPLKSVSHLAGKFNAIIFSPTDLRLLSDGPKVRRKFLDMAICQLYPTYIEILRGYTKAVTQRNKILKDFKNNSSVLPLLDVFENEIALSGEKIIKYRLRYIEILKEFIPEIYKGISNGQENLEIEYISSKRGENLLNELKNSRKEDVFTYKTSVGPHRDDLEFKINGISAKNFGSQGQKRSVALSLKLAEAEILKKNTGEYPICLLDDIMSELDPKRQNFILNHIKEMQTFLSCCDPETLKNLKEGKRFQIKSGEVL
jgi:DNA replication and repair protein RecF